MALTVTPLPTHPDFQDPHIAHAYARCLDLQPQETWRTLAVDLQAPAEYMAKLSPPVVARTLGYALIYAPTTKGRRCVAREINAANADEEILAGLAYLYIYALIRVFRTPKGPAPSTSMSLSPRDSFEAETHMRERIMVRDSYRCRFTGKADRTVVNMNHPAVAGLSLAEKSYAENLQIAHIISQSLTDAVGGLTAYAQEKLTWVASAAAVFDRFTGVEVADFLEEYDLHSPRNSFLATTFPHGDFDELLLWLEPVLDDQSNPIPHSYHLKNQNQFPHPDLLAIVTFNDADLTTPPPSPELLALHAACAHIFHMSGAAEVLEDFDRDLGPHPVLSMGIQTMEYNPAAAAELNRALWRLPSMAAAGA
ncbi:hypothetical protein C8F01DRAFT_577054 [Mycena amicta]|nr:hypothetical protein C8F01DRAFT_577054 [Mycena amicta]